MAPASAAVSSALERADEDVAAARLERGPDGAVRRRLVAIGDPQAPLATFLEILDGSGLLEAGGRLRTDVRLISMGDHFDWGSANERSIAARDGTRLLRWLSAHPPDQVTLLAGNHDLARLGELAPLDDRAFAEAQREADALRAIPVDSAASAAGHAGFRARFPSLPTPEHAARDFSGFRAEQRDLVRDLLRARRLRAATTCGSHLFLHAGVTESELDLLGLTGGARRDPCAVAAALNRALDEAADRFAGEPLALLGGSLHRPGSAHDGEARGMFIHRAMRPTAEAADELAGPPRRRYDARALPVGLTQVIGHIADGKCRQLLGAWARGAPDPGRLRHLVTDGREVVYQSGVAAPDPARATIIFTDHTMSRTPPERYELLELPIP